MAGGYPTFLLGKTTTFSDIDFVLMINHKENYEMFFEAFVKLLSVCLDSTKQWDFDAFFPSDRESSTVEISPNTRLHFKGTNSEYQIMIGSMLVLKLKESGKPVADFCFFVTVKIDTLGLTNETIYPYILDKLASVDRTNKNRSEEMVRLIQKNYDSAFVKNVAWLSPLYDSNNSDVGDGPNCCDVSCIEDDFAVDKRMVPLFPKSCKPDRVHKYTARVSTLFKSHVRELRRLSIKK